MPEEEDKHRISKEESLGCLLLLAVVIICFTIYKCVQLVVT